MVNIKLFCDFKRDKIILLQQKGVSKISIFLKGAADRDVGSAEKVK